MKGWFGFGTFFVKAEHKTIVLKGTLSPNFRPFNLELKKKDF